MSKIIAVRIVMRQNGGADFSFFHEHEYMIPPHMFTWAAYPDAGLCISKVYCIFLVDPSELYGY